MDLRTRTSLFCGALALAIAISILLRGRTRRPQLLFTAFAADIGLWYLAQWLYHFMRADVWVRFTAVLAVLLPQFALHLFEAIVPQPKKSHTLLKVAGVLMVPMLVLVVSPLHSYGIVRGSVMLYVFGLLAAGLWSLALRGERSRSRAIQKRVRFLVLMGTLATTFSLADFLWFIGAPLPPVGAVLSIVFLFVLAESMTRERLVDVYDILGQLLVSTALAFCLAGIFYVFVVLFGGFDTMYLGAILAAIVILVLFEPLHEKVENYIHKVFFRERVDLERSISQARSQLIHVLQVSEMSQVVISALESSRRATGAALYLRNPSGQDFELRGAFGPEAPARVDLATARPLLERLGKSASVVLEAVGHGVSEQRRLGWTPEAEADERLLAAAAVLGPFKNGVCLAIHGEVQDLLGILVVMDDRVHDAFSPDEVALLESLAVQVGVVVENSRQYLRLQEKDRLAALGQMAAGLAHEVRNPLGAIKGAAQLLNEPEHGGHVDPSNREFLDIILEEADRLDRVVGSVLDYARPSKGNPRAIDVNEVVEGTLRVLASDRADGCSTNTELSSDLPLVRADAEQLRQVIMNLARNAIQAMSGSGTLTVATCLRRARPPGRSRAAQSEWVEIQVRDQGPGIPTNILKNLFVPFFTTKDTGTGLGLAIRQRIVEEMGGRIEVVSKPGEGSTFSVLLPMAPTPLATPLPTRVAAPADATEATDADGHPPKLAPRSPTPSPKPA